jgi:hypothetical protein
MASSLGPRELMIVSSVEFCMGDCEEKSWLQECYYEKKTFMVISGVHNLMRLL